MLKKKLAASAEASFEAVSRASAIASGIGTMKIRKTNGKATVVIHFRPRKRNPPAASKKTKERAINAKYSLWLRLGFCHNAAASAASPPSNGTAAHPGDEPYSLGSCSRRM